MKQKIEWYREVLELEPGSQVFFPLAKLLAADSQMPEAVEVLHKGLLRRPDHVEARLLLVELLSRLGDEGGLDAEMTRLEALLSAYPAFWQAWSGRLSRRPDMQDAALAGHFLSLAFQGKSLSWAEVIEEGLRALGAPAAGAAGPVHPAHPVDSAARVCPVDESALRSTPSASQIMSAASEEIVASPAVEAPSFAEFEEEDAEEPFSLRTRSMADVLAEQGDIKGALEIYRELEPTADPEEQSGFAERIAELEGRLQSSPPDAQGASEKHAAAGADGTRLVDLLESLAKRLEARAR